MTQKIQIDPDKVPDSVYDLACIRLQILEMLVRLDRVGEAMQAAQRSRSTEEEALTFSQCLVNEQNARIKALAIAKQGLELPGMRQYDLANWTYEIAWELDNQATAKKAKITAFKANSNFADYLQVAQLVASDSLNIKSELLTALTKDDSWHSVKAKVDI